jgi:hypothetical protein
VGRFFFQSPGGLPRTRTSARVFGNRGLVKKNRPTQPPTPEPFLLEKMLHVYPYTTCPHTPQNSKYPSYSTFTIEYPHTSHTHTPINVHFPPSTFRNFARKRSRSSTPLQYSKVQPPPISKLAPRFPFYFNM